MLEYSSSQSSHSRSRRLFTAADNQNVKEIRSLIKQVGGARLDDEDGQTPSHLVAKSRNSIEFLELLTEDKYVNLNAEDNRGYTTLHYVIERQKLEEAQILIEAGADIVAQAWDGKSPLHILIEKQVDSKIIESFINIKNKEGENSLFTAVRLGNMEITKLLIDHGCDINCVDYFGSTLLHEAAKSNIGDSHFEIAKVLLKSGLDVNAKDNPENTALHFLVEKACNIKMIEFCMDFKANVNIKNVKGEIPLFKAIEGGNLEAVRLLIDHGSDINSVSDNDSTVLHKAASCNKDNGHFIAELLLKKGAYLNTRNKISKTPLHLLVYRAQVETVELFLNSGADVHVKDDEGETPLFKAVRGRNAEVLQLLVDHGSDVNCMNNYNLTRFRLAASLARQSYDNFLDNLGTFEVLLKNGAFVDVQEKNGESLLHNLVYENRLRMVRVLLKYTPKVNIENKKDELPLLILAIKKNDVNIMQLLLDHGYDVNCVNGIRQTPMHLSFACYDNSSIKVVKCLLKNGADANVLDLIGQTPLFTLLYKSWSVNSFEKKLKFMLTHSDINIIDLKGKNLLDYCTNESYWNLILEHMAKLQALNISINPGIVNYISDRSKYNDYFSMCSKELTLAKNTKLKGCWITFFNLLVDNRRKVKNYAGNTDLLKEFKKKNFTKKFSIYGSTMRENLEKGIKRRKLFDESAGMLSNLWPIFSPTHLVIRDILDCCLATKDLSKFCESY